MSYNVTENLQSEAIERNFIDVGIHENVELYKIVAGTSDKGNDFLAFYFKNENGKELSHTEWKPIANTAEQEKSKITNQMKRVKHIATKFIPGKEFVFNVENFKDFAEKTKALLENKIQGVKVRIKAVYDFNNYVSLPKYTPFIENMSVPKEKSRLEISSIDKMIRDKVSDVEVPVDNPFNDATDSNENTESNLPF